MGRNMRAGALCLMFGLLMLTGCQNTPGEQSPAVDGDTAAVSVVETDVTLTAKDYAENSLTVLNVWATWCPPCVGELPELQKISQAYEDKGVVLIGVLADGIVEPGVPDEEAVAAAQALLQAAGVTYRIILPDETIQTTFIDNMQYFPTTFFIDAEGTVVKTVAGANDYTSWSKLIDEALETLGA